MKILLLEDDPIISDIIIEYLESNNYIVNYAFDIDEAQNFIESSSFDLFLFDVNVPSGNGFDFLKELRDEGNTTPTIFITALNNIEDMKIGFNSGCDDYIKKPFELEELELRINNIKRIYHLDNIVNIDTHISIDKSKHTLTIDNNIKHLRDKEILILLYLATHHNKSVSNEELSQNIWDYDNMPSDATIRTYIKNLRNAIGSTKIETIKGVGYRFIKS